MRITRKRLLYAAVAVICATAPAIHAEPNIDHPGLECIEPGTFAVVLSGIDPEQEIQTAKVYFRSSLYSDFYYVEMTYEDGRFIGILPQPSPETTRIIYYVEAVDSVFESGRSREFDPLVEDPCDDKPAAAYLPGDNPGIIIGATTSGASPLPPGFSAIGIAGTITAAGVSSGIGGGVSAGAVVAAAAGAAGVAGGVAATDPQEETTTTTVEAAPPPATVTTTVATSGPGPATTSTTSTAPPEVTTTVATTTTAPGGTSTTTAPGPTTTTMSSTSSSSTTTSSSSTTTTTASAGSLNPDCFTIEVVGECSVRLDATCVNLPVDRYDWVLDTGDTWRRVTISNGGPIVDYTWNSDDCEDDSFLSFRLTVHRGTSVASASESVFVPGNDLRTLPEEAERARLRLQTHLALPSFDCSSRGRVLVDGAFVRVVTSAQPATIETQVGPGRHTIEAVVGRGSGEPGLWRFDFQNTERLVPGSLRVVQGTSLSVEAGAVVFRLGGEPGERVRFDFELAP